MAALTIACASLAHAGQPAGAKPVEAASVSLSPCSAVKCTVTPSNSNLQPTGGHIVSGSGHITQAGDTTDIVQTSPDLFLSWLSFNVGSQDTVNFVQPSSSAIAVNRILGSNGSEILGHLSANGEVWLVNPNGIVFGEGAEVNVGGLIASTLSDVTLSGNTASFSGNGTGSIVNEGTITAANGGYVALLGNHVGNEGTITARLGTVALGAGSAATLTFSGASLVRMQVDESTLNTLAENGGVIQADGGTVIMSAGAKDALLASVVNNTGVIEARTVENHDGTIELLGGMAAGTVNVGGTLDASAPDGGNGGFIETNAAHVEVANDAKVTTLAATGRTGTWLIDPTDFTVAASGGDMSGATLSSDLNSTNTTILSSNGASPVTGGGSGGNINVNDTVSWSANTTLTLTAANNVNVNANMSATGDTAGLVINPNTTNTGSQGSQVASGAGAFNLNMGNSITLSGTNPSLSISGNAYTVINALGAPGSTTGTDLQGINGDLFGYYALGSNIDATATSGWNLGAGFTPIGNSTTNFTGSLNGLGHAISNLTIHQPSAAFVGLFEYTGTDSVIQNVGLVGESVSGNSGVGGLVGDNAGTVSNSYATGNVSGASDFEYIGGLVAENIGTVSNSYATGRVSGGNSVGGLVGYNYKGTVSNSYATGRVSGGNSVGGLVGENSGMVGNSYATGSVSGSSYVGGLVGYSDGVTISNSYATGSVSGTDYVGGLVGLYVDGTVTNSYATGSASGASGSQYVGGLVGDNYGAISNSYATGSVSGISYVGGLVGHNEIDGDVSTSYSTGSVSGGSQSFSVGGLVGDNTGMVGNSYATGSVTGASGSQSVGGLVGDNDNQVSNSYATGSVSGSAYVGGLVGYNNYGSAISNSYATGSVSGSSNVGGLVAYNVGTVSNSFWNTTTSGQATSAGGTGLTTAQMQTASNFTGFTFTTTPGASGDNWVIVDTDGSMNNASGAPGATFPMLASEYSTTVNNAHQLQLIAMNLGASYTLGQNINASATGNSTDVWGSSGFVPIGVNTTNFTGTFNGLGHTISNLTINLPSTNNVGLFGTTDRGSVIQNVGLVGASISGSTDVGALVGANGGTVIGSYATGSVSGSSDAYNVGGLVGVNSSTVSNSYATGSVSGGSGSFGVGGLVGYNGYGSSVTNSYATGSVSGTEYVGGLVGANESLFPLGSTTTVTNSYATGNVSGSAYVGGLVGVNSGTVSNSYATGSVSGSSYVGGLAGYNDGGTVSYSFWDTTTSGQSTSAGGTGLTDSQMQTASSFTGWSIATTGGSGDVWRIYEGHTYPLLISFLTPLTLTDAPDATVTYNGSAQSGASTAISGVLGQAATGTNAGFYNGYYSTQQGYDITGGNLTINPASLTLSGTRVYDGSTIVAGGILTATGVAGQTFSVTGAGDSSNLISKNVQTDSTLATVTGLTLGSSGNGGLSSNYYPLSTTDSSITITPLALTGVSIASASSTYGSAVTPGVVSFGNVIGNDVVSATASLVSAGYSGSGHVNAGTYAQTASGLTGTDAGDYGFSGYTTPTNTYTVNPFALTVSATGVNRTYDGLTDATVTLSDDRFAGDMLIDSYTSASFGNGNAGTGRRVNVAGISVTGTDAGNYTWNSTAATTANISRASLTVTANPATETYTGVGYSGDSNGATYTGFVDGQTSSVLGGSLSYAGTAQGATNAGSYHIRPEGLTSPNYAITYTNGTLTITKAPLTITANGFTETYDGLAYSGGNGVTYTGFVDDQTSSVLGGTLSYGGTAQGATNAGSYHIRPEGQTSPNYAITYTNGTLTITKAPLTITADSGSVPYTGTGFSGGFGVTYSGFVDGQTASVLGGTLNYAGSSQGATAAGTYTIRPEDLTSSNYLITWVNGTLTIQ